MAGESSIPSLGIAPKSPTEIPLSRLRLSSASNKRRLVERRDAVFKCIFFSGKQKPQNPPCCGRENFEGRMMTKHPTDFNAKIGFFKILTEPYRDQKLRFIREIVE